MYRIRDRRNDFELKVRAIMHAPKLANATYDERKAWEDMLRKPFPKLSGGFVQCFEYSYAMHPDGLWQKQMGYTSNFPVPVRFFTGFVVDEEKQKLIRETVHGFQPNNRINDWEDIRDEVLQDLHRIGCKASSFMMSGKSSPYCNYGFYLPRHQPNVDRSEPAVGAPEIPKSVPDFEGAMMFLAYLIHKGWVTDKDMPVRDAVYPQQDLSMPFDRTMFTMAKSIRYQNKVRAGLGEHLLTEPNRSTTERGG